MRPLETIDCNFTYTAPEGMADCGNLPCRKDAQTVTSWWEPTPEERATIAAGGMLQLTVFCTRMPPVGLAAVATEMDGPPWNEEDTPGQAS